MNAANDDSPPTLDEQLQAPWWFSEAQRPLFEAVADCTRDGVRIGSIRFERRAESPHESRAMDKHGELLLAAYALVAVGIRNVDFSLSERPDFVVTRGAQKIGLEVTQLIAPESAQAQNVADNIRIAVQGRLDSDAVLRAQLGDRSLSVNTWDTPKRSHEPQIVEECCRLIGANTIAFRGNQIENSAFPKLSHYRGHVYESRLEGGMFDFTTPPSVFDPNSMASIAMSMLAKKKEKAAGYGAGPLWLVMSVTDTMGAYDASIKILGATKPNIEPFELVVVRGNRRLAFWTLTNNESFEV